MVYTQEQIDRANQVNLEQFLRSQGEQIVKSGNEYRWKRHDSLTIKGNKWFRHSQSKGGYPVEFVMEFFAKSFPEAVFLLIGEEPTNNSTVAAPSADFKLPPRNRYAEKMIGHLNKASGSQSTYRGLGSIDITAVVRSLLFIGKVRSDPTTRVIVHEKSSLAPPGQSLAFSLGDEKGFRWIGAYDISAEDLLAGGEGSKTELKQEQAVKLIEEFLSEGRKVSIAEINKEATERGISERTVRLARNSMGDKIASERQGKDWWIWFK